MIFHKDLGFPKDVTLPTGRLSLDLSMHALDRAKEKGFSIPKFVTLKRFDIIEIMVSRGRIHKFLIRGRYDAENDICIVVLVNWRGGYLVKTAWLNHWQDTHKTLDASKYGRP